MRTLVIAGLLLAAVGCDRNERSATDPDPAVTRNTESARPASDAERQAADNSGKNERDRNPGALTPGDQGESEADRNITQAVRQSVMKQDGLSMNAKNVKIITANGVVTLRGPVESANEKATIGQLAQGAAGVTRVDNQLEIAAK